MKKDSQDVNKWKRKITEETIQRRLVFERNHVEKY